MEKISFDNGVRQYKLGQGILKLNPTDPNLFLRFEQVGEQMTQIEKQMQQKLQNTSEEATVLQLLAEADAQIKQLLNRLFGLDNDFDKILGGVNLLAVSSNGQRVVTNLFAALEPVLAQGARECASQTGDAALEKARQRRNS